MNSEIQSVYLAGPIDLGNVDLNWKDMLKTSLEDTKVNVVLFDPASAFKVTDKNNVHDRRGHFIEGVNTHVIDLCDLVVCVLPHKVPTVGTIVELDYCYGLDKPVLLITDIPYGRSVYLNNRIPIYNWLYTSDMSDPLSMQISITHAANRIRNYKDGE